MNMTDNQREVLHFLASSLPNGKSARVRTTFLTRGQAKELAEKCLCLLYEDLINRRYVFCKEPRDDLQVVELGR